MRQRPQISETCPGPPARSSQCGRRGQGDGAQARATILPREYSSRLESEYATYLELLRAAGRVQEWSYEAIRLRLADGAWYMPDFRVIMPDGTEEYHEVKGFWREAARVRIKVAAEHHPYVFRAVIGPPDRWSWDTFTSGAKEWNP